MLKIFNVQFTSNSNRPNQLVAANSVADALEKLNLHIDFQPEEIDSIVCEDEFDCIF